MLIGAKFLRRRLCLPCDDLTIHSGKMSGIDMVYHCNECLLVTTIGEEDEGSEWNSEEAEENILSFLQKKNDTHRS